jgi:hypothetical protein
MIFLFAIWTFVRNIFESSVWATLVWTALEPFSPVHWLLLYWGFFVLLSIFSFIAFPTERWLRQSMLAIDPMLVGLAVLQAAVNSLIATIIIVVIAALVHLQTNWVHVFLFFGSGLYILWRRNGKRKAVRSWQGREAWDSSSTTVTDDLIPISTDWIRSDPKSAREFQQASRELLNRVGRRVSVLKERMRSDLGQDLDQVEPLVNQIFTVVFRSSLRLAGLRSPMLGLDPSRDLQIQLEVFYFAVHMVAIYTMAVDDSERRRKRVAEFAKAIQASFLKFYASDYHELRDDASKVFLERSVDYMLASLSTVVTGVKNDALIRKLGDNLVGVLGSEDVRIDSVKVVCTEVSSPHFEALQEFVRRL